ncbi:MAG: hypothetical protein H6R18_2314 [Proteobacteria bacterium]|nr:hypothetical protein [Pseudomonadota bacterium]
MATELFTSWGDYQIAIDRLLALAQHELRIYDKNLVQLKLENPARIEMLKRLLANSRGITLRITLRDAGHLRDQSPRLMELLRNNGHRMAITETPENLAHLRDGMILADDSNGLILFDQDQPRCKLIVDDIGGTSAYLRRFEEIWQEGGHPFSASVAGL